MDKSKFVLLICILVLVILLIGVSCFKVLYMQQENNELSELNVIVNNEVENVDDSNYEEEEIIEENIDIEEEESFVEIVQEDEDLNQEIQEEIVEEERVQEAEEFVEEENVQEIEEVNEVAYIENYEVAGYLNISKIGINIPVLKIATADSTKISAAILYGPGLNVIGNTTILGANYEGMYFEKLHELENGDEIIVTDQNKQEIIYEVYDKQKVEYNDASYMIRDTNGAKEITFLINHPEEGIQSRLLILTREKSNN